MKKQRKMLVDEQEILENFTFVMSPETVSRIEENAFFASLQLKKKYDGRG